MPMTKHERLETIIAGELPDRPAVALWRHWPIDDRQGNELARATLDFQRAYDFDFIKVTPNSNFCVADYGLESFWEGNEEGTYRWGTRRIQTPEDWYALRPLNPYTGLQGEVLLANRLIGQAMMGETPFIQTIFNPLAQAKNLAGPLLLPHLRQYPDAVRAGLKTITTSTLRFIEALRPTGVAGIFLAIQHASYALLSEQEYRTFGQPFDQQILEATGGMWFNVVHLHGERVMFDLVGQYPAQVINWHDQETLPTLCEALDRTPMTLCGGLRQWATLVRGTPDCVCAEADAAIQITKGRRFILGTGCVTPIIAPTGNLLAARQAVGE